MSAIIKCLIVDDEPIGREIIENFVKQINYLEVIAVCEDAFEALGILQNKEIDLLITDIQMPKINGLEFVRSLPSPPVIIFITGYDQFAVNSFELGVADYLLKPVSLDRFLKAINKAKLQIDLRKSPAFLNLENKTTEYIFIKANNKLYKTLYKDIIYIESITRIHNSYLVQINAIKAVMANTVELGNHVTLPISKSHKEGLFTILQINNSH